MRRSAVPLLLAGLALALGGLLVYALARPAPGTRREQSLDAQVRAGIPVPAPGADRMLASLDGSSRRRLADLHGRVVVLNFWAKWCLPCRDEAPLLERTHKRLQKTRTGTVLGVVYQSSPTASRRFERENGMTYPSLLDPGSVLAREDYGVTGMPETFVIDRRGRIRAIARGEIDPAFLADALRRAGAPAAATGSTPSR